MGSVLPSSLRVPVCFFSRSFHMRYKNSPSFSYVSPTPLPGQRNAPAATSGLKGSGPMFLMLGTNACFFENKTYSHSQEYAPGTRAGKHWKRCLVTLKSSPERTASSAKGRLRGREGLCSGRGAPTGRCPRRPPVPAPGSFGGSSGTTDPCPAGEAEHLLGLFPRPTAQAKQGGGVRPSTSLEPTSEPWARGHPPSPPARVRAHAARPAGQAGRGANLHPQPGCAQSSRACNEFQRCL